MDDRLAEPRVHELHSHRFVRRLNIAKDPSLSCMVFTTEFMSLSCDNLKQTELISADHSHLLLQDKIFCSLKELSVVNRLIVCALIAKTHIHRPIIVRPSLRGVSPWLKQEHAQNPEFKDSVTTKGHFQRP